MYNKEKFVDPLSHPHLFYFACHTLLTVLSRIHDNGQQAVKPILEGDFLLDASDVR